MNTLTHTRRTDPETSAIGEIESRASRESLVERVVAFVTAHPGLCRGEIARGLMVTDYALSKRLSDAANARLIHRGDPVRFQGRLQTTWLPGAEPTGQMELL